MINLIPLHFNEVPVKTDEWRVEVSSEKDILLGFFAEVCAEAETIMAQTNTVAGAHYNAMLRVLKRRGCMT